jgi:hypothetical protein
VTAGVNPKLLARDPRLHALLLVLLLDLVVVGYSHGVGGTVNRGDSAKFQFLGVVGGVSHPPGNPLYLLLDVALVHALFFVPPSLVVTGLSLVCGVAALAFLGRASTVLTGSRLAGAIGIVAVGLGPVFWTLSTEPEVYALNALLLAALAFFAARHLVDEDERSLSRALAVWMLAFGNHLTVVALAPAFLLLLALFVYLHGLARLARLLVLPAIAGAITLALYGYVALRIHQHAPYSEFSDALDVRSFWQYLTAKKYQGSFSWPSLRSLAAVRFPQAFAGLQRQWVWVVWIAVAWGMLVLARLQPRALLFFALAVAGLLFFPLTYAIGDPDGFLLPVIVLAGIPLGASVLTTFTRRDAPVAMSTAILLCLFPMAAGKIHDACKTPPAERVIQLDELDTTGWDLPDIVARIAPGTRFVEPCGDYGCAQVLNYYRFGDSAGRAKGLTVVHLPGGHVGWHALWPELSPTAPGPGAICALLPSQVLRLRQAGIVLKEIPREPFTRGNVTYARPSLFCTD